MEKDNKTTSYIESDVPILNRTRRPILNERIGRKIRLFGQRLTEIIGKEPVRSFARRADISEGAIRQYMSGNRYPDLDFLAAIAVAGEVNLLWLATGEGPKTPQEPKPEQEEPTYDRDPSMSYGFRLRLGWIRKAVQAVEMMGKDAAADQKALAVEKVYNRLEQTDGAADMIELMRVIQAALEGGDTP